MIDDEDDPALEWKIRALALPGAVLLALIFHSTPTCHFLQRTFLSMPVHELGHAVTAWWSGFAAIPTVWKTLIPEDRSIVPTLAIAAVTGFVAYRAYLAERRGLAALAVGLLALAAYGTFARTTDQAQATITFGGDAGAMILGTLLVLTMFAGPTSRLRTNQLRWGFLVIGVAAYVDTFFTWWRAQSDTDVIPFGEIEGVGQSDPSKLVEVFDWSVRSLIDRYVLVGVSCALVMIAVWGYGTWRMRAHALSR